MLCDSASGRGALQCQNYGGCPGAKESNCQPYVIWSGTPYSSGYYHGYLNSGSFSFDSNWYDPSSSFGVRCVLDLKFLEAKNPTDQLCDANSGYGALRCYWTTSCPGANGSNCYPYNVWSGTPSGSNYVNHNLNSGTFNGPYNNAYTNAFSVRCVLDLKHLI